MIIKDYGKLSFYEIYPATFRDANGDGIGDLKGIEEKLPYIASLGFTGIWINPIFLSPFRDGGYDIADYYKVDPRFGNEEDLDSLIKAAHSQGIAVFLDLVPGHASIQNPDFLKTAEANSTDDLFIWTRDPWHYYPSCGGNLIKGMFDRNGQYYVNFFCHQPALNYGFNKIEYPEFELSYKSEAAEKTRHYIANVMKHYLKKGVDGFRVDMADSLVKNDEKKEATIWTWQQIIAEVQNECGKFYMVSEWANPHQSLEAGFDSDFVLDHEGNFCHGFFRIGTNGNPKEEGLKPLIVEFNQEIYDRYLPEMLDEIKTAELYPDKWLSPISGNHDVYRLADMVKGNSLKLAYVLLFTLPGVPFVFAGDEIEQLTTRGYPSKDGGFHRTGARLAMSWDDSKPSRGFSTKPEDECYLPTSHESPSAENRLADPDSIVNLIKKLNEIRSNNPDLTSHEGFELMSAPLSFKRGQTIVGLNLKDEEMVLDLGKGELLLTVGKPMVKDGKAHLGKHEAIIFQQK